MLIFLMEELLRMVMVVAQSLDRQLQVQAILLIYRATVRKILFWLNWMVMEIPCGRNQ